MTEILANFPETAIIVGCGYVGSRVADTFRQRGMKVFIVTRSKTKAQSLSASGFQPIVTDISNASTLPQLPDADLLLWSVGFDRTPGVPRDAVWIEGLQRVLEALPARARTTHDAERRILYTSSTSVYGDCDGHDVDEFTTAVPVTEGGTACLQAEQLLKEYAGRHDARVTILRLAGIYGPERLLRRLSDLHNAVPITSHPEDWLNLIHVDDVVAAIDAISRHRSPPSLINIVAGNPVARRVYYETLARMANAPAPVFCESRSPGNFSDSHRPSGNRRVVSTVRPNLGLHFQYDSIEDGLRNAIG